MLAMEIGQEDTLWRQKLSNAKNLMQDMTHAVFWDSHCLTYFVNFSSMVWQYDIVDLRHGILRGSRLQGTLVWLIKSRCATTLKLVKLRFDVIHWRRVLVHYIKTCFDFPALFPFRKQKSNNGLIFFFFIFSKAKDKFTSTGAQKNYESESVETSTVNFYPNILQHNKCLSNGDATGGVGPVSSRPPLYF